jgi:hypothetical protein
MPPCTYLTVNRFGSWYQVDDVVIVMDEGLRGEACRTAGRLRAAGRRVDLVLQPKKMKWVFKHTERSVRTTALVALLAPLALLFLFALFAHFALFPFLHPVRTRWDLSHGRSYAS